MKKDAAWEYQRNKLIYYKGKKIKLRKYIYVAAAIMRAKNKKGWQGVNHVQNYKIALKNYGFKGIAIYEDYFYKGIPLPENRTISVKIYLFIERMMGKYLVLKNKLKLKLKK